MRERVLESIAALGYHVNTTARNLRRGRTGVIGLAVPDVDRPYFGLLANLLIERAAARGFELVIEQTAARRDRELDAIDRSRLRSYDGLILSAVQLHDDDALLLKSDFPIVVLGERSYSSPLDRVVMANEQGAAMADATVAMLVDRINGQRAADQYETVVGSVRLVQRESTAR